MNTLKQFFFFDEYITPKILKFLFWISVVVILFINIPLFIASFSAYGAGFFAGLTTLISMVLQIIGAKVLAELTLVLFRIEQNTRNK